MDCHILNTQWTFLVDIFIELFKFNLLVSLCHMFILALESILYILNCRCVTIRLDCKLRSVVSSPKNLAFINLWKRQRHLPMGKRNSVAKPGSFGTIVFIPWHTRFVWYLWPPGFIQTIYMTLVFSCFHTLFSETSTFGGSCLISPSSAPPNFHPISPLLALWGLCVPT